MTQKWIMKQTWENLLFVHWPVDASWLQTMIPSPLKVDTYEEKAWISLVPFEMTNIRFRGLPSIPYASSLSELNVRTYVRYKGERGVFFFSLDASHHLGVWIARHFFHLPYFKAVMSVTKDGEYVRFVSSRAHRGMKRTRLKMTYQPSSVPYKSEKGSIEEWLTERYCLFTTHRGSVYKGALSHEQWLLQDAVFDIQEDTLTPFFKRPDHALLAHFSKEIKTSFYPFERI
ncbi:YqjF family protein [Metabacillus iocasae]|uniref:Uncharacterized protein YqjF (DUF2071 family) n=1 Tax=Priestia iocasae TaxID=2291674 RepID=A0ABS2QRP7_9BACI|nr:DUF2071 domain-containing protein [Metabacillus iocasae]MBM7702131.1 uncharacterized protein YqjF (DUF2071 family) [Metabacillus iocasae]